MKSSKNIVESYLEKKDWRVKENSNAPYSFGAMNKYIGSEVSKDYWLRTQNTSRRHMSMGISTFTTWAA